MYVVDVIPFSRTAPAGTLSYRSRVSLLAGTIVEVSLRRRMVRGLVVGCQSVAEAKAMLKSAPFILTKAVPRASGMLPESYRTAAEQVALLHAATLGSTLTSLLDELIRSAISLGEIVVEKGAGFEYDVVETDLAAREARYRTLIEMNIAGRMATLLVVPTIAETEYWRHCFADTKPVVLSGAEGGTRREAAQPYLDDIQVAPENHRR